MNRILMDLFHISLCILWLKVFPTNSRTSTLWKLNSDQTKIIEANSFHKVISDRNLQFVCEDDPVFKIITSTVHLGKIWIKEEIHDKIKNHSVIVTNLENKYHDEVLDCGNPVNFTYYDNLVGVLNRNKHPKVPEPQAALSFGKKYKNVDALEHKLKKAKREKPKSVQLYNQIGNFWRIKGDAKKSIECFRRALSVSPHNSEVLLNLARVLFTLQYLDDAIYLTRRSLEVQSSDKGAWQQYFTLGQILKAYGHYQEASIHLKHSLDLKPGFEPAQVALKEIESMPASNVHVYTLVIIICLVLGVLLVILSSVDGVGDEAIEFNSKTQKHFNKAMAMKSLKGFSQRHARLRKC